MNKFLQKLLSLLIITAGIFNYTPAQAALTGGVWTNDLKTLFTHNQAIILAINIRSFNALDKDKNDIIEPEKGDIQGNFVNAVKRLDEISTQGINTIHILPFTPSGKVKALGTAGSLYAISDFTKIDPMLDDQSNPLSVEEEAKNFIKECHKRNIRVIADLPSCGSYDLFLSHPNLFMTGADGKPVVPFDWTDVRVFKTNNADGTLNNELYSQYKAYVDLVQRLGVDGIRADVATSKPFDFWKSLISYAKSKDPEFLFLAEASESWNEPVAKDAPFTPYHKLLEAGFDGWYGSFFNFKNWKTQEEFQKNISLVNDIRKSFEAKNTPKAVIGSFATHDEPSPIITGKEPFAQAIMWLQATLPVNSYFVDGIQTGDAYQYKYGNQKASNSYTDDEYYFVHKGKFDIFNFSRKPAGNSQKLAYDFAMANSFKAQAAEILNKGELVFLNTNNSNVFAYMINYRYSSILVVLNKNLMYTNSACISVKNLKQEDIVAPLVFTTTPVIGKGKITMDLMPSEITVLMINKNSQQKAKNNTNMIPQYR